MTIESMRDLAIVLSGMAGIGATIIFGFIFIRWYQHRHYDRFRRTYIANFPRDLPLEAVLNFMRALSGLPTPRVMQPVHSVVMDVYGDVNGIKHYLSIPGHVVADVESLFRTHIAGGSLVKAQDDLVHNTDWDKVAELGSSRGHDHKPIRTGSPDAVAATILSSFSPLKQDQAVLIQWVIVPAHTRDPAVDKEKLGEPNFLSVGRLASKGEDAESLVRRIFTGLRSTQLHQVRFANRLVPSGEIKDRIYRRSGVLVFPIIFNALELAIVSGFPFGAPNVPGLPMGRARHLAPDNMIPNTGFVLGRSSFPGLEDRALAVDAGSLMKHMWVLGPTGVGKSTLLHGIAAQVMEQGHGLVLIEPKGDLARDVLRSVPSNRIQDVVWFDPTDVQRPIGLNLLAGPDPERTSGHITGLFKSLYGDSWGPRLEQILRYSVLTAAVNQLTLHDVKQLLINPDFRARIVRATKDYETRTFWRRLEDSPDNAVDSVVNKLDAFVGYRAIRNIVGQTHGLNMEEVVRERKILLVPLPSAILGEANASMLGTALAYQLWQQIRLRPPDKREPIIYMADEFQNFADQSVAFEEMFAAARSYGLGLVVANQHTGQLKGSVLDAVKANARSKVAFGLNPDDAKKLKDEFATMGPADLQTLAQYEVACALMTASGQAPVATARTLPPPMPTGGGRPAMEASRARYGRDVHELEAEMRERHKTKNEDRKRPTISKVME